MTDNIVASVSRFLTPELIGKLTSAANLDRNIGQRATTAIVPAILSGLASVAGTPAGSRQLVDVVAQQPTDMLGNFVNSLTGSAPQTAAKGMDVLSTLLGGGALGLLTSTLSKFLAVGETPTRSLMGLLTPLIMGVLGQQQKATGLDANGLARMLTQQKEEITNAMPSGLSSLLESSGLYQRLGSPSVTSPPRASLSSARRFLAIATVGSFRIARHPSPSGSWRSRAVTAASCATRRERSRSSAP